MKEFSISVSSSSSRFSSSDSESENSSISDSESSSVSSEDTVKVSIPAATPKIHIPPANKKSGLKLVIPSLKSLKAPLIQPEVPVASTSSVPLSNDKPKPKRKSTKKKKPKLAFTSKPNRARQKSFRKQNDAPAPALPYNSIFPDVPVNHEYGDGTLDVDVDQPPNEIEQFNYGHQQNPYIPYALDHDLNSRIQKLARPVKLKPLKEVLFKLIAQIKKKDDYAFFLRPVNPASVPGYSDIVKKPMDFGTMTNKVARGRYRSLEDFANDFRLVTTNAKLFNPAGSIYHAEAEKIEAYGIDHINKAASTVIQYETDWNIDVVKNDEDDENMYPLNGNVDDMDEDALRPATPMEVDYLEVRELRELRERERRSSSIPSHAGPSTSVGRRGVRGPYRKQLHQVNSQQGPGQISESLDADGGLPGSREGLGAFPACSDWANTMVRLKRKGKRYKTKKERLRVEKEGPPLLADGSLDYFEMEDPFSVLSALVPNPPSKPLLLNLFPDTPSTAPVPSFVPQPPPQIASSLSASSHVPQLLSDSNSASQHIFPFATSLSLEHPQISSPFLDHNKGKGKEVVDFSSKNGQAKRRHWTISRQTSSRQHKGKERERDDDLSTESAGDTLPAREASVFDYGSLGVVWGGVVEELRSRSGISSLPTTNSQPQSQDGNEELQAAEEEMKRGLELLRRSFDCESAARKISAENEVAAVTTLGTAASTPSTSDGLQDLLASNYWTTQRAAEAEAYIRDLVYGGVEGYAYVRSLAEFVDGDLWYLKGPHEADEDLCREEEEDGDVDDKNVLQPVDDKQQLRNPTLGEPPLPGVGKHKYNPRLGMPLAEWVVANVVDPLTEGRHSLLRETALELARQQDDANLPPLLRHDLQDPFASLPLKDLRQGTISSQVSASLRFNPAAHLALSNLLSIRKQKIDMGALIRTPNELFLSEEVWFGRKIREKRKVEAANKKVGDAKKDEDHKMEGIEEEEEEEEDASIASGKSEGERKDNSMDIDEPQLGVAPLKATATATMAPVTNFSGTIKTPAYEQESSLELSRIMDYVAGLITELDRRNRDKLSSAASSKITVSPTSSSTLNSEDPEDPSLYDLRLNLLALAKRAPLDTIARLPKDLVPEHIRHFVPDSVIAHTSGSAGASGGSVGLNL